MCQPRETSQQQISREKKTAADRTCEPKSTVQLQVNLKLSSGKRQQMNENEACSRSKPVKFPEREEDQTN